MTWRMEFYHERRGIMARYAIEAPLPPAAVVLGWKTLLAEHLPDRARARPSLFARAQHLGGQDESGWVLYRIVKANGPAAAGIAPGQPT